jgi:tetratricopeptide (TPR) repeat protein
MAIRNLAPNHRLERLMIEAGFTSHKAFARAVRKVSEEPQVASPIGCDHTSVSRWLHGMKPRADTALCIVTALSRALGRPVSLADAGLASCVSIPPDLGLTYPSAGDGNEVIAHLWHADLDGAAGLTTRPPSVAAWQSIPLNWLLASRSAGLPERREGTRVGFADVQRIRTTIELFAQLDNRFGGGHARRALIQYLADDVSQVLNGRYRDRVATHLLCIAAQATLLAAWMSYDSGLHGIAQRYFIQALSLAEAGNDQLLSGSILDAMSHQATFLGHYQDAANLARAARSGTQTIATPSLTAHFYAMEARALARLGDTHGCERALADAVSLFERRNPDSDPEWFRYFDDAELAAEFGHCYRDVGRFRAAMRYTAQSIGSTCGARSDFFVTMVLADAQLRAGEAEQACLGALGALRLGEQLKSARCVRYLRDFHESLTSTANSVAVREFQERAAASALWRQATQASPGSS